MSDYSQITDFSVKDALASGNPSKIILGADIDAELSAISTAVSSKLNGIASLTEDTSPDKNGDYVATYDSSAGAYKKVLLPRLIAPSATLAALTGNTIQVISATTWTEVNCVQSETIDTAGIATSGQIKPPSSLYDGYYLFFGRLSATHGASTVRFAITRFNSGGVAQSRKYVESYPPGAGYQAMCFAIHNLTNASGDYVAMEVWIDSGVFSIPSSSQNELIAFKF